VYKLFWSQMIRWLVTESDFLPGQDIWFGMDRYNYTPSEKVRFVVRTKQVDASNYQPKIEVTTPNGSLVNLIPKDDKDQPGTYIAFYTPDQEGEFKAALSDNIPSAREDDMRFTVYADSVETRLVAPDRELMSQIAQLTGGSEIPLNQL